MYKLQVLTAPLEKDFLRYKKLVRNFIWDDKKPKISYQRLISDFSKGGLQLRDLRIIDKSVKFGRAAQMLDNKVNSFWKNALSYMMKVDLNYLLSCNFNKNDIVKLLPNTLFKDVLINWAERNYFSPVSVNEILSQNLWYNSHICKLNRWLFNESLFKAGIKRVIDIYDLDEGSFYTYDYFLQMFLNAQIDFVTYYGVVSSIPDHWARILKRNEPSPQPKESWLEQFKLKCTKAKTSKIMYSFLRDEAALDNSTLLLLWNNDLRTNIVQKKFDKMFISIKKITSSTKLHYFQYRILVRALTTNVNVARWDQNVSPLCSFCNNFRETSIHIFTKCVEVKKIWNSLVKWMKYMHKINIVLQQTEIIFNNFSGPHADLVNITKFYIYKTKVQGTTLNFRNMICAVNTIKSSEHIISLVTGKHRLFQLKWCEY